MALVAVDPNTRIITVSQVGQYWEKQFIAFAIREFPSDGGSQIITEYATYLMEDNKYRNGHYFRDHEEALKNYQQRVKRGY